MDTQEASSDGWLTEQKDEEERMLWKPFSVGDDMADHAWALALAVPVEPVSSQTMRVKI